MRARARLAGSLYLAVNVLYIASLAGSTMGPEAIRRPAVALQAVASTATIALAWALYELVKPAGQALAFMALLFRVAEAAVFGVTAMFSLMLLDDSAAPALLKSGQLASGQIGQIYFCPGSAIFFYLLGTGRVLPRWVAAVGVVASVLWLAAGLVRIGAPAAAGYLSFSDPLFLLAETVAGIWLLVAPPADVWLQSDASHTPPG